MTDPFLAGFDGKIGPGFTHTVVATAPPMPPQDVQLSVPCPKCPAGMRTPCVRTDGSLIVGRYHSERSVYAVRDNVGVIRRVECPTCAASVNAPCVSRLTGKVSLDHHGDRKRAAEEALLKHDAQKIVLTKHDPQEIAPPVRGHVIGSLEALAREAPDSWATMGGFHKLDFPGAGVLQDATPNGAVQDAEPKDAAPEPPTPSPGVTDIFKRVTDSIKRLNAVLGETPNPKEDDVSTTRPKIIPEQIDMEELRNALNEKEEWLPKPKARAWNIATGDGPFHLVRHINDDEELIHVRNPTPEAPNVFRGHHVMLDDWWLVQDSKGGFRTVPTALLDPNNPKSRAARAWDVLASPATLHVLYVLLLACAVGYVALKG